MRRALISALDTLPAIQLCVGALMGLALVFDAIRGLL